ncbi:MAG: class I SAM-dependent RNA methyltransferase [Spirochaetaceae bacterium]|jgi:23S rRNA (uracil1939-C5)-methyltransferase|nr:class I SAM-dependent RNA methyltransferase [Spirochaetaceae bacterium]
MNDAKTAPCRHFGHCGGCTLQDVEYPEQLARKEKKLAQLFERAAGFGAIPAVEIVPSAPYGYRDRFQFHRVDKALYKQLNARYKHLKTDKLVLSNAGLAARRKCDIIPIDDCPVANPLVRDALREGKIKPPLDKDRWTVYGRDKTLLAEGGKERGKIILCGKEVIVDAGLFFQSNGALLETLIKRIVALAEDVGNKERAGDFYCGVGTFAVFLQDVFPCVDLLDENPASIALARDNMARTRREGASGEARTRFWAMTDHQWAKERQRLKEPYDFLVVDPSRQGLSPMMRAWLRENKPRTLVYASCDPVALVRDAQELTACYALETLTLYDFYPQTEHMETLAVFRLKEEGGAPPSC